MLWFVKRVGDSLLRRISGKKRDKTEDNERSALGLLLMMCKSEGFARIDGRMEGETNNKEKVSFPEYVKRCIITLPSDMHTVTNQ